MYLSNSVAIPIVPYLPDALNTFAPSTTGTVTSFTAGTDWLAPFSVRQAVTIDGVFWHRQDPTAANVYVGIYDDALNLLTDCAVDADMTAPAFHVVSTTPITLIPGKVYYFAINQSVIVASRQSTVVGFEETFYDFATRPDMVAAPNISHSSRCYLKARANAALLNPAVLSGWTATNLFACGGFVKQ